MLVLGIDIGTSSLKLGVVDLDRGKLIGWSGKDYALQHPQPGWSEQDAEHYWWALVESLDQLKQTCDLRQIKAIGVSSQAQTFVPIDAKGHALQRAWTWIDGRASTEASELNQSFSSQTFFQTTGITQASAGVLPSMIKHFKNHSPDLFTQTWKFLVTNSYLIWRLTGRAVIDENQAAMGGMYDWHRNRWWPEMLEALGVEAKLLPEVLPSGTAVEKISAQAAEELGLSNDVTIVTGANDQTANALGAGLLEEGDFLIVLGTALVIFSVLKKGSAPVRQGIWSPYPILDKSYQLGCTNSGCGTLDWAKQLLAPDMTFPELFDRVSGVPAGSDGVTCLIDLDGRAEGDSGNDYRGIFAGLSRKTDRWCMLRSVLEGVACSVRELTDEMGWDIRGKRVRTVGGAARSDLWMQIHADVLGSRICRLAHDQSGVVGSAIMAAVGSKLITSHQEAVGKIVKSAREFSPNAESVIEYEKIYRRFRRLRKSGNIFYGVE